MLNWWWKRSSVRKILGGGLFLLLGLGGVAEGESEKFIYQRRDRDPFWPLVTEDGKLVEGFEGAGVENLYLEGIVWDISGNSFVMINGMILHKGDRIGEFKILKIEHDRVTLKAGDVERELRLEKLE